MRLAPALRSESLPLEEIRTPHPLPIFKCPSDLNHSNPRPNLNDLLNRLQAGDTLIVTKLDRFARTATEGNAIVKDLHERGVNIHILNMGMADNTPMGKLVVTMLLAFAEFERDMIVERTQSGKAIARANGKRVDGRPKKFSHTQIDHAMELLQSGNSFTQVEKMTGISVSTLKRTKRGLVASQV